MTRNENDPFHIRRRLPSSKLAPPPPKRSSKQRNDWSPPSSRDLSEGSLNDFYDSVMGTGSSGRTGNQNTIVDSGNYRELAIFGDPDYYAPYSQPIKVTAKQRSDGSYYIDEDNMKTPARTIPEKKYRGEEIKDKFSDPNRKREVVVHEIVDVSQRNAKHEIPKSL